MAKEAMNGWFEWNKKPEKEAQQAIVRENARSDAEFYVLDVEYQINTLTPFKYEQMDESDKQNSPRPDIIAVGRRNGLLYVMELKKGCRIFPTEGAVRSRYRVIETLPHIRSSEDGAGRQGYSRNTFFFVSHSAADAYMFLANKVIRPSMSFSHPRASASALDL